MINIDKNLFLQQAHNIIAITSGVGSMGKTWLTITLAHALNILHESVLLFDADNGLLNIEAQLGAENENSLNKVLSGEITLNQAMIPLNRRKFEIISGTAGSNVLESTPQGRLHILREELLLVARNYHHLLIDLPASDKISDNILPFGSELILVCTNEPSNIVSTYKFLQECVGNDKYKNMQIIVNYVNSYEEGLQTFNTLRRACEKYISKTPSLLGVVRRDTRVRDAIRNHALLLTRYPNSEAADDIMQIAHKLLQKGEA